jgi:hypothetical protein
MNRPIDPSIIAQHCHGPRPELGPVLGTGQRRAVLGWNHKKDNSKGLSKGKIWCWVGGEAKPKLQVYDTEGNRAPFPGMRVDCGPASKWSLKTHQTQDSV